MVWKKTELVNPFFRKSFLGLVGVGLMGLMALSPTRSQSTTISWASTAASQPGKAVDGMPLLLSRHVARTVHVTIPCFNELPPTRTRVFATSNHPEDAQGLLVVFDKGHLEFYAGYQIQTSIEFGQKATCPVSADLEAGNFLTISSPSERIEHRVDPQTKISGIYQLVDSSLFRSPLSVEIETFPSAYSPTLTQYLLMTLSVALSVLAGWQIFKSRKRDSALITARSSIVPAIVVLIGLISFALLGPVGVDDGWVAQIAQHPIDFWNFVVFRQGWDTRTPTGIVTCWTYWLWTRISTSLIWFRILPLSLCFATYLLTRRVVASIVGSLSRAQEWTLASVFTIFAWSWLLTMRSEPTVAFLSVVTLSMMLRYNKAFNDSDLLFAGLSASLAFSLHPSGVVAIGPILLSFPNILDQLRSSAKRAGETVSALAIPATLLIFLLFGGWNFQALGDTSRLWNGYIRRGWRDEFERYVALFSGASWDTLLRRLSFMVIMLVLILSLAVRRHRTDLRSQLASLSLLTGLLLLPITQTKWPWHFGALAGYAIIGLLIELHVAQQYFERWRQFGVAALFVVGMSISARSPDLWGIFALVGRPPEFIVGARQFLGTLPGSFIVATLPIGFCLWLQRYRKSLLYFLTTTFSTLAIFLAISSFAIDSLAHRSSWSIGKQNVLSLSGTNDCGLEEQIRVADPANAVQMKEVKSQAEFPPAFNQRLQKLNGLPGLSGGLPLGRLATPTLPSQDGYVVGSWYSMPRGEYSMFVSVRGEFAQSGRKLFAQVVSARRQWTIDLTPRITATPLGSDFLTIDAGNLRSSKIFSGFAKSNLLVRIGVTQNAGWPTALEFSSPTVSKIRQLRSQIERGLSVVLDPFYRMYFPCISERPLQNGIVDIPDLVIGKIPLSGTSPFAMAIYESSIVQLNNNWAEFLEHSPTISDLPPVQRLIAAPQNALSPPTATTSWK
jgi:arabinosyltransferase A